MRPATLVTIWLVSSLPTLASASCYSIYSRSNELVYQSTLNPIDLSLPISQALRPRFPGHHLVMDPNNAMCTEVGEGSASARPAGRPSSVRATAAVLESSSLLREGRSPLTSPAGPGDAVDKQGSGPATQPYVAGADRAAAPPAAGTTPPRSR